jgi:DNA-binding MarR family transcriptional regulator
MDFVLHELAISPQMFFQLLMKAKDTLRGHDQRDLRDGIHRVLRALEEAGLIEFGKPLPGHYLLKTPRITTAQPLLDDTVSMPILSKDQRAILLALREPGLYSRDALATAVDPKRIGVDQSRITRAVNGAGGLKAMGLVTHSRRTGYSLTEKGRQIAAQLSS